MYLSTTLLALAAAVGLINAATIPLTDAEAYDICIEYYLQIFGDFAPAPGALQCTGCAAAAVVAAGLMSTVSGLTADVLPFYNSQMAQCNGLIDDQTYNTCVKEYSLIFPDEHIPGPYQCTGCSVGAVSAAAVVYRADPTDVAAAREKYYEESAKC